MVGFASHRINRAIHFNRFVESGGVSRLDPFNINRVIVMSDVNVCDASSVAAVIAGIQLASHFKRPLEEGRSNLVNDRRYNGGVPMLQHFAL